jgi:hypothetical protein
MHGSIPLVRNAESQLLLVPQLKDYHYRNHELVQSSLYESVATSYRREISREKNIAQDSSSSDSDEENDPHHDE